jgi:hypothetical protein
MHLSSENISLLMAGYGTPADHDHLQSCVKCRCEVEKLQDVICSYSGFAREWGRSQVPPPPTLTLLLGGRRRPRRLPRWVGVAAAAVIAVTVLVLPPLEKSRDAQPPVDELVQDALLLQQVNARISRTAPLAMEPLLIWMEKTDSTTNRNGEEK